MKKLKKIILPILRTLKIVALILVAVIIVYVLINLKDVAYGISQLKGQMHIINNARPVTEVLNDTTVSIDIKRKLLFIENIRKYAIDSLGLKNTENYTTLYDQQNKPVLWVLTASYPFEMRAYEWEFPYLGKVPYKGFFEKAKGEAEEKALLKKVMLDTELSTTGGWSTLGFFKDPILSNMLKRKEGQLAELIIHEMLHATVYIPGNTDYNENLATFVGEQGALRFLRSHFGENSIQHREYIYSKSDEELYGNYMLQSAEALDSVYQTFSVREPLKEKLRKKYHFILKIVQGIDALPLYHPERYRFKFPGNELPGNAWFMSFKRYRSKQTGFEKELKKHDNDLKKYIQSLLKK
jgi:predicted aminopeptidase